MTGISAVTSSDGYMGQADSRQPISDFADALHKERPSTNPSSMVATRKGKVGAATDQGVAREGPGAEATPDDSGSIGEGNIGRLGPDALASEEISPGDTGSRLVLEARIFGLHLFGSDYLSEYSYAIPDSPPGSESRSAAQASPSVVEAEPFPVGNGAVAAPTSLATIEPVPGEPLGSALLEDPSAEDAAAPATDAAALGAGMSPWTDVNWSGRSLRLLKRSDGGQVAWIRDYTISPDETHDLAHSLVEQARMQGLPLHKIMLNGHEIWSSTDNL